MIYITGDTHGEQNRLTYIFSNSGINWTANDYLIVCGDFGYMFTGKKHEEAFLNDLENIEATILFVDGNHENFDLLYSYPEETWNGGKIHRIRKNVIHLMRGQVFTIQGKKIFTMGGGYSIDRYMRCEGVSWWPQEMPNDLEFKEAIANLKANDFEVDYIITHTAPENTMCMFHPHHEKEYALNNFLEWVRESTKYEHWYFGHLHTDKSLWLNQTALWFDIIPIETEDTSQK